MCPQPYRTTPLILPGAKNNLQKKIPTDCYLRHHPNPQMRGPPTHDFSDIMMKQKVADSVLHRVVGPDDASNGPKVGIELLFCFRSDDDVIVLCVTNPFNTHPLTRRLDKSFTVMLTVINSDFRLFTNSSTHQSASTQTILLRAPSRTLSHHLTQWHQWALQFRKYQCARLVGMRQLAFSI